MQGLRNGMTRFKNLLRPSALRCLGSLPVTSRFSGLGHVLMFHRVVSAEEKSPYGMAAFEITPRALEMTLEFFIKHGYRAISLDDMCDSLRAGGHIEKFVVLTFDDGYRDTLTTAYPILKAHGAPFTVNVTVGFTNRSSIKWDYLAEEVIDTNDEVVVDTPRGRISLDCSTAERKRDACDRLQGILYQMNDADGAGWMKEFFAIHVDDVYRKTDELMLNWGEVERLAQDPLVTIGAHSVNHHVLSRLREEIVREEVLSSKALLESRLGVEVGHFAYPYGRFHEAGAREHDMVRQGGFRSGSTGMKGNIFSNFATRLECLPRFCLGSNCNEPYLRAIVNGSLPFLANRLRRSPR